MMQTKGDWVVGDVGKQDEQWKPCSSSMHPSWLQEMKTRKLSNIYLRKKVNRFPLWERPGNAMPVGIKRAESCTNLNGWKKDRWKPEERDRGEKRQKVASDLIGAVKNLALSDVNLKGDVAEVGRWQGEQQYGDHSGKNSLEEPRTRVEESCRQIYCTKCDKAKCIWTPRSHVLIMTTKLSHPFAERLSNNVIAPSIMEMWWNTRYAKKPWAVSFQKLFLNLYRARDCSRTITCTFKYTWGWSL